MTRFCYVWSYEVAPDQFSAFEETYGPEGAWAVLFGRDPAYLGTELIRDRDRIGRYLTIDRWTSRAACLAFRERNRDEFAALDDRCGQWTILERELGEFDLL
jgi:hypothetical protein